MYSIGDDHEGDLCIGSILRLSIIGHNAHHAEQPQTNKKPPHWKIQETSVGARKIFKCGAVLPLF